MLVKGIGHGSGVNGWKGGKEVVSGDGEVWEVVNKIE